MVEFPLPRDFYKAYSKPCRNPRETLGKSVASGAGHKGTGLRADRAANPAKRIPTMIPILGLVPAAGGWGWLGVALPADMTQSASQHGQGKVAGRSYDSGMIHIDSYIMIHIYI